MGHIYFKQVAV